jgi:hypothetical protein
VLFIWQILSGGHPERPARSRGPGDLAMLMLVASLRPALRRDEPPEAGRRNRRAGRSSPAATDAAGIRLPGAATAHPVSRDGGGAVTGRRACSFGARSVASTAAA